MSLRNCARFGGNLQNPSCATSSPVMPGLALIVKDKSPMGLWQEGVHRMVRLVESERVGAHLGPSHLETPYSVRLEHLDQPRIADRDIEMAPGLVEEDDIWDTGELSPR